MLGFIGLFLSLAVLILLSFKKWNPIITSIVASVIMGIANNMNIFTVLNDYYMAGAVNFIRSWFLVFTLGAIFSEFLSRSGSVASIAYKLLDVFGKKNALFVVALITAILTIGGVNPYVQIFLVWPICVIFSRETDMPRNAWVGVYYLGMLSAYSFPGNPCMANVILAQGLNVSSASAPILSLFLFVLYFSLGMLFFKWQEKSWQKKGMHYVAAPKDKTFGALERGQTPSFIISLIPMILVVALYCVLSSGAFGIEKINSTEAILISMLFGIAICIVLNFSVLRSQLRDSLIKSSTGGINPTMTAAVVSGYLGVVMNSPTYGLIVEGIQNINGGAFIQAFVACSVLTFITGSGTVAATPVLTTFSQSWLTSGASAGLLRSVMASSISGMSISPHCGGLHGVLDFAGSDLKESYSSILFGVVLPAFVTSFVGALIATFL